MRLRLSLVVFPAVLLAVALLAAGCGGDARQAEAAGEKVALGRRVYQQQCATCHQSGGEGIAGIYPTLHDTRWTQGDGGRLIRLVLHGMEGPVEVKGETYDQLMQPRSYLSDEEVAAVLTYVRQDFGNDAAPVSAKQVAAVRAATTSRDAPWVPGALWQATGIPAADSLARDSAR